MSQYSTSSILGGSSAPAVERSNPAMKCPAMAAATVLIEEFVERAPKIINKKQRRYLQVNASAFCQYRTMLWLTPNCFPCSVT